MKITAINQLDSYKKTYAKKQQDVSFKGIKEKKLQVVLALFVLLLLYQNTKKNL